MEEENFKKITKEKYLGIWEREKARSVAEFPSDAEFIQYDCLSDDLLKSKTYYTSFTDSSREEFLESCDEGATPINFLELRDITYLREKKLSTRGFFGLRTRPHLIAEHCLGCGVRFIKDGCKELLYYAWRRKNVKVTVTEVRGRDWSKAHYDMPLGCRCKTMQKDGDMEKIVSILVVGQAVSATGFSRVLHSVLDNLKDTYDIHHFGINYFGEEKECGWKIYPNKVDGDISGVYQLASFIERIKPQLVFLLNDLSNLSIYSEVLSHYKEEFKVVAYTPLDGEIINYQMIGNAIGIDELVLYTDFAKTNIENAIKLFKIDYSKFKLPQLKIIPHGIDTKTFHPLRKINNFQDISDSRRLARKKLFPRQTDLLDSFIVLNANRNQPRKRLDITLHGFALFAENKPKNVNLYLHSGLDEFSVDVLALAKQLNIEERLLFTEKRDDHPEVSSERLNLIYNACDVGLNTSSGEGWGLVSFEHAASGAAQIVPRHSACEELWQDAALFLEPIKEFYNLGVFLSQKLVSPEDVASALEQLYNRSYLEKMSLAAYKRATQEQYQWKNIAKQWDILFQGVLSSDKRGNYASDSF